LSEVNASTTNWKVLAVSRLAKLHLTKALKGCRNASAPLTDLEPDLSNAIQRLLAQRSYGPILSAYYEFGEFGIISVFDLLKHLAENRDFPTFLKQAYRFNVYSLLHTDIERALTWHEERESPDASAWRRKFGKLREQEQLATNPKLRVVYVQDDFDEAQLGTPQVFELRPLTVVKDRIFTESANESANDLYIVSSAARAKIEQATTVHQSTLRMLKEHLAKKNCSTLESKLIDAYSVLHDGPAIFEIKSINGDNEREQKQIPFSRLRSRS
jgi:hypothetical protein